MESVLQKKILSSPFDYESYRKLADYYLNNRRPSLALFCLTESLRIKPDQPNVYNKLQPLLRYALPIIPEKLKPEACFVSVIMRTFNRRHEIRESIESVLAQSIDDYELVIINDGGIKEIKEIVDSFASKKIKYLRLPENKGPAGSFNAGLMEASGKYIAYLDDDDIYYPEHLEKLTSFMEFNPEFDCVYSNSWWCYGEVRDNKFIEYRRELKPRPEKFDKESLFKCNYITTLSLVYKRSNLLKAGLFNEDFLNMEDWEHLLRLALNCNFYQMNVITGEYRWKNDNGSIENTKMDFMSHLIFNFYHYGYLSIVQLRHALDTGDTSDICEKFDAISSNLSHHLNRHANAELLFNANLLLAKLNSRSLRPDIVEKYFDKNSLNCIKLLTQNTEWKQLVYLASFFIHKIFSKLP